MKRFKNPAIAALFLAVAILAMNLAAAASAVWGN